MPCAQHPSAPAQESRRVDVRPHVEGRSYADDLRTAFGAIEPQTRDGRPLKGHIEACTFGGGRIVTVEGAAHQIHRKADQRDATSETFSLLIQDGGSSEVAHCRRSALLLPGQFSLIDGSQAVDLDLSPRYQQLIVQFPRTMIGRHYPHLLRSASGQPLAPEPATDILAQMARATAVHMPLLSDDARVHVFQAMIALLGALPCAHAPGRSTVERRFARAMADIEAGLSDPDLDPAALAGQQRISRRRLDAIFAERGLSVERVIWDRRLERAAAEIALRPTRKLLDVALQCGFSSENHFSRRFRLKFGCGPREYRAHGDGRLHRHAAVKVRTDSRSPARHGEARERHE